MSGTECGNTKKNTRYVCTKCGYVYDPAVGAPEHGAAAGVEFCALPESWTCPKCRAGKEKFFQEI